MYGAEGVVRKAFPFLTQDLFDRDGLVYLSQLREHFDYKGCGVFASKKTDLALLLHPFLRRSLSRFNSFNTGFIEELLTVDSDVTPVRLRIDDLYIGFSPSYIPNIEFEFWYGPSYSDDIMSIPEGLSKFVPDEIEKFYNPVCKTEFMWEKKDGKRQFEMEEVTEKEIPMQTGVYGCRYLHSFYNPTTGVFDHFDGAIRMYDEELMTERREKQMTEMGHRSNYTKVFRVDGKLPLGKWKGLITQYLKDNMDVYRYFDVEVPFNPDSVPELESKDPLSKYVPYVLAPGDGIRMLVSYHKPIKDGRKRFFSHLDYVAAPYNDKINVADLCTIDLTKCLRREGIAIDYPVCSFIDCNDGFANLPVISHDGESLQMDVNETIKGFHSFLDGLQRNGVIQCLSFGLSWNIDDDRSVVISIMGAISDILNWMNSFHTIPARRKELKSWLENQVKYIHLNGCDDVSPINAGYIQSDGTFFQRRRNVQEDVIVSDVRLEDRGMVAEMEFSANNADLQAAIHSKMLGFIPLTVVEEMICKKSGKDYLSSPYIAPFGETTCQIQKIKNLSFVWCRSR